MTPAAAGALFATALVFRLARKYARAQESLERSQLVQNPIAKEVSVPFQSNPRLEVEQCMTNRRSAAMSISRPRICLLQCSNQAPRKRPGSLSPHPRTTYRGECQPDEFSGSVARPHPCAPFAPGRVTCAKGRVWEVGGDGSGRSRVQGIKFRSKWCAGPLFGVFPAPQDGSYSSR